MSRPGALSLAGMLVIGSVSVSFASIFVRLAAAPALPTAAWRLAWATVIFAPFALSGPLHELRGAARKEWRSLAVAGAALALHFALWIASLGYTSVASSVLLVDTTPFFIGLAGQFWLGHRHGRLFWTGLAVSFLGCLVIFRDDWSRADGSMAGNFLALGGAVAMAAYLLAGGELRRKLSLLAYVWPVYGAAAVMLIAACLAAGEPLTRFPPATHLYFFLLGLVPQCIGHTTYNWSLRWLPAGLVGLITLAEPVGASILAYLLLGESLSRAKAAGGLIVLAGIYTATRSRDQAPDPRE
ncbi:MAG: DMT family transporter [Acidobacteriota bacterium]